MRKTIREAFQTLHLDESATHEDVNRAFKSLAVKYHPDKAKECPKRAEEEFKKINHARDVLLNKHLRLAAQQEDELEKVAKQQAESKYHLRGFSNDVTNEIENGTLSGEEVDTLFRKHKLWAVWVCTKCELVCTRIRKEKYSCMCSHRLRDHSAGKGFRCSHKCGCSRFQWAVQHNAEHLKCRCKHSTIDHAGSAPYSCTRCDCKAFHSPWRCNCGHDWADHETRFVAKYYTPRCREWVAGGLPPEIVARADRVRRARAERVAAARF